MKGWFEEKREGREIDLEREKQKCEHRIPGFTEAHYSLKSQTSTQQDEQLHIDQGLYTGANTASPSCS
jgi:hypothetical protein